MSGFMRHTPTAFSPSDPRPQPSHSQRLQAKARYATSCTECRRRKQKCSQGRPCTNCLRRFPQTTCEYTTASTRRSLSQRTVRHNNVRVVVEGPAYSHLDVSGLQDAILQLEREARDRIDKQTSSRAIATKSCRPQQNTNCALKAADDTDDDDNKLHVGFKTTARTAKASSFNIIVKDEMGLLRPQNIKSLLKTILHVRVNFATKIVNDEYTLDSRDLLRMAEQATPPPLQLGSYEDHLRNLPMASNKLNVELVRLYLQLLCRFKAAVDGAPDPTNRFMRHWVPFSIKSPLNLQIILYTSACFLNETGQLPKAVAWVHKSAVHKLINQHIATTDAIFSDDVIMGTAQMVLDSWYWGTTQEMKTHMLGLKSMVQGRGGLQVLGMQGFLAKTIITDDITIALAHEISTSMFDKTGFEFTDEFMVPYQVSFNSPFMSDWPPFSSPASTLDLHPNATQILDDMRNLLRVIIDLPQEQVVQQLQQVAQLAVWTYHRIMMLPEDVPQRSDKYEKQQEELEKQHQIAQQHIPLSSDLPPPAWTDTESNVNKRQTGTGSQWEAFSPDKTCPSSSTIGGCTPTDEPVTAPDTLAISEQYATPQNPDLMYRVIRSVALIYCRAILARVPTSQVCNSDEFMQIWANAWDLPLTQWKTVLGVYHWITVGLVPSGHDTPPARFSKMLMVVALLSMGLDNWHICMEVSRAALKLQKWLRNEQLAPLSDIIGGEAGVLKYGFPNKEDLPAFIKSEDEDEGFKE